MWDTSGFYAQTAVMLHAARACLVANRSSNINMEYVGGKNYGFAGIFPTDTQLGDGNCLVNSYEFQDGYISFLPNAFDSAVLDAEFKTQLNCNTWAVASERHKPSFADLISTTPKMTTGGMCVRAVDNSEVTCKSTSFTTGYYNHMLSGAYYNLYGSGMEHKGGYNGGNPEETEVENDEHVWIPDEVFPPYGYTDTLGNKYGYFDSTNPNNRYPTAAGTKGGYGVGGSQVLIWNICDTSRLKCLGMSVVGLNKTGSRETFLPYDFGKNANYIGNNYNYHGPEGAWHNGAALDYYGTNGYAMSADTSPSHEFGGTYVCYVRGSTPCAKGKNKGMFRIYLGTRGDLKRVVENNFYKDGAGNFVFSSIGNASGLGGSPMAQLNAQGYMTPYPTAQAVSPNTAIVRDANQAGDPYWQYPYSGRNTGIGGFVGGENYEVWGYGGIGGTADARRPSGLLPPVGMGTAGDAPFGSSGLGFNGGDADKEAVSVFSYALPRLPLHTSPNGWTRNWLCTDSCDMFANAKHLSHYQVGGISIFRAPVGADPRSEFGSDTPTANKLYFGSESSSSKHSTTGTGCRSHNVFDLGFIQ